MEQSSKVIAHYGRREVKEPPCSRKSRPTTCRATVSVAEAGDAPALQFLRKIGALQRRIGLRHGRRDFPVAQACQAVDPISARDGPDVRPQRPRNEPEISACARGEFEACLEQERI